MPGEEWALPGLILAQKAPTNVMFNGAPTTARSYGTDITYITTYLKMCIETVCRPIKSPGVQWLL